MERPPPLAAGENSRLVSFQTVSGCRRSPRLLRCSWVPPTAVPSGSDAGQATVRLRKNESAKPDESSPLGPVGPASPEPVSIVTPLLLALTYALRSFMIAAALWKPFSGAPKLCVITLPR